MAYGAGKYWRNRMKRGMRPAGLARMGAGRFGSPRHAWWRMAPSRTPLQRFLRRATLSQLLRLTERRLGWAQASSRLLSDFREQIVAALEQEGGTDNGTGFADEAYDAAAESIDTSGTVEPVPPETPAPQEPGKPGAAAASGLRPVTTRALNKIFEEWEARELKPTRDGYPRVDDINDLLHQEGYETASPEQIREAYDKWMERGGADEALDRPARGDIFEAFDALVGRDVTEKNVPYVKDVNEQLRQSGYAPISAGEVRTLYQEYLRAHKKRTRVRPRR